MISTCAIVAIALASIAVCAAGAQPPRDPDAASVTCRVRGDVGHREFRLHRPAPTAASASAARRWQLSMRDAESGEKWIDLALPGAQPVITPITATLSYRNANGGRHVDLGVSSTGSRLDVWVDYGLDVNIEPDLDPRVDRLNTNGPLTGLDCVITPGSP